MASALDIEKIVCRRCYAVLDAGDNFCRHCGASTGAESAVVVAEALPDWSAGGRKWSQNRWVVLAMLFLVLGPLGLPMLWRSREFSPTWKAVVTTLILAVTAAVAVMIWLVAQKTLQPLMQLRDIKAGTPP